MTKFVLSILLHVRSVACCLLPIAYCLLSVVSSAQKPLKGRDESIKGPQSFAIVVGVSHYRYIRPLAYADKDAELFRDWLRSPAGGKMSDNNIFCLLNDQANNSNFWGKGFQWLKKKDLQKGDKLFIYLAGHGDAIDEDQYFFLGYDCKPDGDKNNYLVSGAIQLFNLKKKIAKETSKGVDVVFIMDACRSNELPGGSDGQNFLNTAISQKQTGEIMMLATAAGQESVEDVSIGNGHGLFTWFLIDGLTGLADVGRKDNKVSFTEISNYVDSNVHSLALQRFKKKQDPYFCCNENSEKIVGVVDTNYLQQWQRIKKQQEKRSGRNSFTGTDESFDKFVADTFLIETYNRFNRAVKNNSLTGNESAEYYFQQLNLRYPGNPYTLDAKSTLAVEWLDVAQTRVNRYLDCITDISITDKQANFDAAINLEKAIASFKEDDEDFANSLYGRLYLLKASGDFGLNRPGGPMIAAFAYAYSGLAFEPNGAYILNKLAQLHLENNNRDSALYYANKAVKIAPGWACALTTLAKIQNSTPVSNNNKITNSNAKTKSIPIRFGINPGIGLNISEPSLANNPNSTIIAAGSTSGNFLDLGIHAQIFLSKNIDFRPQLGILFTSTNIKIGRRNPAGGQLLTETLKLSSTELNITPHVTTRLSGKANSPYVSAGPSVYLRLSADDEKLPLKKFQAAADLGAGYEWALKNGRLIISPELKFSYGLTELRNGGSSIYSAGISSLKRNLFSFHIYIRKK